MSIFNDKLLTRQVFDPLSPGIDASGKRSTPIDEIFQSVFQPGEDGLGVFRDESDPDSLAYAFGLNALSYGLGLITNTEPLESSQKQLIQERQCVTPPPVFDVDKILEGTPERLQKIQSVVNQISPLDTDKISYNKQGLEVGPFLEDDFSFGSISFDAPLSGSKRRGKEVSLLSNESTKKAFQSPSSSAKSFYFPEITATLTTFEFNQLLKLSHYDVPQLIGYFEKYSIRTFFLEGLDIDDSVVSKILTALSIVNNQKPCSFHFKNCSISLQSLSLLGQIESLLSELFISTPIKDTALRNPLFCKLKSLHLEGLFCFESLEKVAKVFGEIETLYLLIHKGTFLEIQSRIQSIIHIDEIRVSFIEDVDLNVFKELVIYSERKRSEFEIEENSRIS